MNRETTLSPRYYWEEAGLCVTWSFLTVQCGSRTDVMARSQRHILLSVEYNELTTLLKRAYLLGCRY